MLRCPNCHGKLPLLESLGQPVVCPHCSSELKLKTWIQFLEFMVVFSGVYFTPALLRARGLSVVPALLAAVGGSVTITLLLHVWLGRYRLKPPRVSITPTE